MIDTINTEYRIQVIGDEYSAISQSYSPVNLTGLPAYLLAMLPPQGGGDGSVKKLENFKKTKSMFPIDLPAKNQDFFSLELTTPVVNFYKCCVTQGIFPSIWKKELRTSVPKNPAYGRH